MSYRTSKAKWFIVAFMLLSVMALSISSSIAGGNACSDCGLQCTNEAWYIQSQCYQNGGSTSTCNSQYNQYLNSCNATVCNYGLGCNLPTNY